MIETTNLKLKKYEDNDVTDPALAFNPNMDIIEKAFSNISTDAKGTKFDNTTNGMTSTNVQGAIEEVFQAGVNAKANMVQAINSKITVPNVTTDNNWDILKQSVINIKEAQGNAQVSQVLSGATFTNNTGDLLTGTMANRGGAVTVTPSTSAKTLSSGYYSGNVTVAGDANLVASNIVSGKSIFGVAGNVTVGSLGGRKYGSGTYGASFRPSDNSTLSALTIAHSLNFTPTQIIMTFDLSDTKYGSHPNTTVNSKYCFSANTGQFLYVNNRRFYITNINSTTFTFYFYGDLNSTATNIKWEAFL